MTSSNAIRVIESKRTRWTGYVARMRDMRIANRIFDGKPEEKRLL
jgi:hypothetical protein